MDSVRYDIYFTGKLVEGHTALQAQQQFAQLFKMTPEKAAQLFTGNPQLIKRNIDKAQALKYKQALHKVGMLTAFKAHQAQIKPSPETNANANANANEAESPVLAAAATATTTTSNTSASTSTELSLAAAGSSVLTEDERQQPIHRDIDTSAIKLVSPFLEPEPTERHSTTNTPDTSHLSIAASGADLLEGHHSEWVELDVDLSALEVEPAGTVLGQIKDASAIVTPDTSQLSIAKPGADLLEDQPPKATPQAPDTSHLSIEP